LRIRRIDGNHDIGHPDPSVLRALPARSADWTALACLNGSTLFLLVTHTETWAGSNA
jgi:hypothetical protein